MVKINFEKIVKYFVSSALFIAVSLIFKYIAMSFINNHIRLANPAFELVYVKNRGAAFSLFQNHTDILIILSIIVLISIFIYIIKNSYRVSHTKLHALAVLTAGISCNLYERIHDGFVTDYLSLNFINFPVFNVSDILITVGAILLIISLYKK